MKKRNARKKTANFATLRLNVRNSNEMNATRAINAERNMATQRGQNPRKQNKMKEKKNPR